MADYKEILTAAAAYSPEYFYSTRDKLPLYVLERSKAAFDKADKLRRSISTKEDFIKYQKSTVNHLLNSLGKPPYTKTERASVRGVVSKDGIRIEKIVLEPRAGVYITALLYMPEKREGKIPAVIFQSGHAKNGKTHEPYVSVCMTIASIGIAVLAFDPIGQGERAYYTGFPYPTTEHQRFGNLCIMNGMSLTSYFLADALASLDYLTSRDEIDSERIGATGSSGGGTMTAILSAVDERIKATAPATFLTDRETYIYSCQPQDAEQIWYGATRDGVDHYELVSAFCPKPYMILGVRSDFFCIEGTERLYEAEKRFYGLFDKEDALRLAFDDSTHAYTPVLACYAAEFFAQTLLGKNLKAKCVITLPTEEELIVTDSGRVFTDYTDAITVADINRESYLKADASALDTSLSDIIYGGRSTVSPHTRYIECCSKDGIVRKHLIWFTEERMPAYAVLLTREGNAPNGITVCLWKDGTNEIPENEEKISSLLDAGRAVMIPDLAGVGKCAPYSTIEDAESPFAGRMKANADLLFLGDSAASVFAFGLLRTLDMIKSELRISDISLYTKGSFGVYADILDKIGVKIPSEKHDYKSAEDIINDADVTVSEPVNYLTHGIAKLLK